MLAWQFGASASSVQSGEEAGGYPMGTTASGGRAVTDVWHPCHAEASNELQVPLIVKWYRVERQLASFLLSPETDAQIDFQLPMLLDTFEKALIEPRFADSEEGASKLQSRLVVGRSGTGKTSIALALLYNTQLENLARPAGSAAHLNALFVCKSKTLANSVGKHFDELMRLHGQPAAPVEALKDALVERHPLSQPLFLSSADLLVLLDRTLAGCAAGCFFQSDPEREAFCQVSK